MFSAVVYSSRTGSCKRYAERISEKLSIPSYELGKEKESIDGKIVYIGWLFGGKIVGYEKAAEKYNIGAVVQVGMGAVTDGSEADGRAKNDIDADIPLFCQQGGFNIKKLPPHLRLIMKPMNKDIARKLKAKGELNEQEQATLKMAETGEGEPASWCVCDIVEWCKAH